jgi:response regulator RpfG family c-di-GMP phosphodiesterase
LTKPLSTIVLIENDEVTLELYQRELCKSFSVFAFTQIDGVLEVIAQQDITAIVIEPEICSGEGWELIHTIHTSFPDRSIPVIVCSTRDNSNAGPALEVARYLTKPVLPVALREKTLETIEMNDRLKRAA